MRGPLDESAPIAATWFRLSVDGGRPSSANRFGVPCSCLWVQHDQRGAPPRRLSSLASGYNYRGLRKRARIQKFHGGVECVVAGAGISPLVVSRERFASGPPLVQVRVALMAKPAGFLWSRFSRLELDTCGLRNPSWARFRRRQRRPGSLQLSALGPTRSARASRAGRPARCLCRRRPVARRGSDLRRCG
jgi:hypothetical protein